MFGMEDEKRNARSSSPLHSSLVQHPLIGYYLSRKKFSKLRFDQFLLLCKRAHIDTVEISYDYLTHSPVRIPQLIVHKLEDESSARRLIDKICSLPISSTILVDPFDAIARLLDRNEQYSWLKRSNNVSENLYTVPSFIRVSNEDNKFIIEQMLIANRISFPIMCKPIQAHGDKSHDMKIIFDANHLDDIEKPCVLQQFIDHDGVLFKIFAVGQDNYHIVQRNSIHNLSLHISKDTISFRSNEVSSSQAAHILSSTDQSITISINEKHLKHIAQSVQQLFELHLVGIDIIVDRQTGDYAVIDVNYFPGYEGVADFNMQLFCLCRHLLGLS